MALSHPLTYRSAPGCTRSRGGEDRIHRAVQGCCLHRQPLRCSLQCARLVSGPDASVRRARAPPGVRCEVKDFLEGVLARFSKLCDSNQVTQQA
eukprot:3515442-Rhodomonas_salina.3